MLVWPRPVLGRFAASLFFLQLGQGREVKVPPGFPVPPDTRPQGCDSQVEDVEGRRFDGLKVSIIIPYRREKLEHIRRSIESIKLYTPGRYVAEVLFVSDGNDHDTVYLDEIRNMSKAVSVLVLPTKSVGLIEAKMRAVGAVSPKASVLVFLEPHIRVNRGWLEPLLNRIRLHPRVLAMPVLDIIPSDNFDGYHAGEPGLWRFEWNLNLVFTNPTARSTHSNEPFLSPGTSGGIFAIRKDWWDHLGFYDAGMVGWGGDHIEATLKVWRCGGFIEVVPCSRVGHMFRDDWQRPYPVDVPQVVRNYARVANIWLDEYLPYFFKVKPDAAGFIFDDLQQQKSLRKKLRCKDMTWYLDNVDTEMRWEKDHICIPGCILENCCSGRPAVPGRSTVADAFPRAEYLPPGRPEDDRIENEEL